MKLAFCLFKYFPYGGLQRDFMRIAETCRQRGHRIHVYTMEWEGKIPPDFNLHLIAARGLQNHTRNKQFTRLVKRHLEKEKFDVVIGFNKMPYLDLYYAADVCYLARIHEKRGLYYRLLPRYRQLALFEEAVFGRGQATEILLISRNEQQKFIQHYQTEQKRLHLLPPGIAKDRIAPLEAEDIRAQVRVANHIAEDDILLLLVGSGFKTKGLDRAILSLSSLPSTLKNRTHLFVIGKDQPDFFLKLAKRLQVDQQLHFLGGRNDVPHFLLASDLLLHPAYHENTGTVLLEAIVSGLPVLTVDCCGYAHYVTEAKAGVVLRSPFQQAELNEQLQKMILSSERTSWRQNGLSFAKDADIYSMPDKTADFIEYVGRKRVST
jgi:UDP-glucose:(heptosyl)LPS alpha-1,3-glucosyltransferase